MTAFFYRKILNFFFALCVAVAIFCGVFFVQYQGSVQAFGETYYVIVSAEDEGEFAAAFAYPLGGAGVLLCCGGKEFASYECCFSYQNAKEKVNEWKKRGVHTRICAVKEPTIHLTGKERNQFHSIARRRNSCISCIRLYSDFATGAERGERTQAEIKDCLAEVKKVLFKIAKEGKRGFFSLVNSVAEETDRLSSGVIYARDLRRASVSLLDGLFSYLEQFSI